MSMGKRRGSYRRNLSKRHHFQDTGLDGRVVITWMLKKWDGGSWTGLIWLRKGTGSALLNAVMYVYVPSSFIKCGTFIKQMRTH
jgi:hypothetical protein